MFIRFLSLIIVGALLCAGSSWAMPNFARKYGVSCSACHTIVPKLNRDGYEFRAAGFRYPTDVGIEEQGGNKKNPEATASKKFNLGDTFAARIQQRYIYSHTTDPAAAATPMSHDFNFHEFTFYPLTFSWGKYFGSLTEFSLAPDKAFEIENAYVRLAIGSESGWFMAKAGIMHAWEGLGASDRPVGLNRPLFQSEKATNASFKLWSMDEQAVEAGYHLATTGTTLLTRFSNGISTTDPAQGGGFKKAAGTPDKKSYQFFANQILGDASALSLYYYHGAGMAPAAAPTDLDTFWRMAVYANYFVLPNHLNLLAGYSVGADDHETAAVASSKNKGWFTEADYHFSDDFAMGVRYETWDPNTQTDNNAKTAGALFANYYVTNGLQILGEYRRVSTENAGGFANKIDDKFEAKAIFIW
ncbi:MAG: hypothetical protein HY843_04320 [Bdellovibrio sp.]|nr:hypothetical protein [Bdellovibrio sp.]